MSIILGINAFHADSAACLVVDGELVSAVAEERLGQRIKHTSTFPANAIRRLLADAGLKLQDVTDVAIARDSRANYLAKARYVLSRPVKSSAAVLEHIRRNSSTSSTIAALSKICGEDEKKISFRTHAVEHHIAHIASAYFLSPFESLTAGFSYDGSGDFVSMMAARCEGNRIEVIDKVTLPHSLGFFYTALCQFIGFDRYGEEYKVMGLAPYGEDTYRNEMNELVKDSVEEWFRLGKGYFSMHDGGESGESDEIGDIHIGRLYKDSMTDLFGAPRTRNAEITQREKDIAKSTQVRFEEAAIHCISKLYKLVPTNSLAMAGGCSLNGVTNARILRDTGFGAQFIQPASSDDGTSLGAAFYVWHQILGNERRFQMRHAFWGPGYSEQAIRLAAYKSGYSVLEMQDDSELVALAATFIAAGAVVGWYQGRSEWGPRALGNRSILANPAIPNMKQIINSKIKRRESFRPFAPSVLKEDVSIYFEQSVDSPFMMHVVKLKQDWAQKLPAITHVDGTGRLQSVDKDNNALYYSLIAALKKLTGFGIVLNTSFNENEPVVDTPEQAIATFDRTDMDVLCLGRFVLKKNPEELVKHSVS